ERSTATVQGSLIDGNHDLGLLVVGSDMTVVDTLVRGTLPFAAGGPGGRGISVEYGVSSGGALDLKQSVVEQNDELGVFVEASSATLDASVVRATQPSGDGSAGRGVSVQDKDGVVSVLTMHASVIERSHEIGLYVSGAQATLESTIVRDTAATAADGSGG